MEPTDETTERITLAKALAVKNRLAGRLVQAQSNIQANNSLLIGRRGSAPDVRAELARYEAIQRGLVAIKATVQRANGPIVAQVFELAELKSRIALLTGLETKHGAEPGYNGSEFVYDATIQQTEVSELVRSLEVRSDQIQDELNAYNAATTVEVAAAVLDLAW